PQRGKPTVGTIKIMLLEHVVHHEAVQRHAPSDKFAYSRLPTLQPEVARVEPGRLDRHIGLGDEILITPEALQRRRLTRLIAIEGEDHLTVEGVMVAHQSAQQPCMIITEGGAA